jgi:hypothetical protein
MLSCDAEIVVADCLIRVSGVCSAIDDSAYPRASLSASLPIYLLARFEADFRFFTFIAVLHITPTHGPAKSE